MSYTKLNVAIKKYCKLNKIPYGYTAENQEEGIKEYHRLVDIMVGKWKNEKKYKELIAVAHGHWFDYNPFTYDKFTKSLAEHFIKENELLCLKVLCERDIRFKLEDTLKLIKCAKENYPELTVEDVISYNLDEYLKSESHDLIGETSSLRANSLSMLNSYIELIKQTKDSEYLKVIEDLKEKTETLTLKKVNLKNIKHKLK